MRKHVALFGHTYDDMLTLYNPSVSESSETGQPNQYFLTTRGKQLDFKTIVARIEKDFPDLVEGLYQYLHSSKLDAENRRIAVQLKANINKLTTSADMKKILETAVNNYLDEPSPAWFNSITKTLQAIEDGKFKQIGEQPDGSCIYQIHLSKQDHELMQGQKVNLPKFVDYALRQYRRSLVHAKIDL
jgi:hypothetical protein